jgi:hypothetical protein
VQALIRGLIVAAAVWTTFAAPGRADEAGDLYRGKTILTGTGEANRRVGYARALEDVLIKVSGDPRLAGDKRVAALGREARAMVVRHAYRDLMEGLPLHDEQGTRDRPYELTVEFDPAKIDAALAKLDRKPWSGKRPRLVILEAVRNGNATYVLAADGERGVGQPESFAAAAWRAGVPVIVPRSADLAAAGLTFDAVANADLPQLDAAARALGADQALAGRLTWSDSDHGWIAEWRIAARDGPHRWSVRGVNFDQAFRNAMRGAAQLLSGNGQPR